MLGDGLGVGVGDGDGLGVGVGDGDGLGDVGDGDGLAGSPAAATCRAPGDGGVLPCAVESRRAWAPPSGPGTANSSCFSVPPPPFGLPGPPGWPEAPGRGYRRRHPGR